MIPGNREDSHSGTVTVEKQEQHQHGFFDEKNTKNVSRISEGCPDDFQRMSQDVQQGQQEDVYKGWPPYIYFLAKQNLVHFKLQTSNLYQQY